MKTLTHYIKMILMSFSVAALVLSGCDSGDSDDGYDIPEARSSVQRMQPNLSNQELDTFVHDNNTFAFNLYHDLASEEDGNIFYSPYSVSVAMGMVWAGAEGNTESQMAKIMRFMLPEQKIHEGFDFLDLRYEEQTDDFQLHVANAVWGQTGWNFLQEFLDTLAKYYGAGMKMSDFMADPEGARHTINQWVEDRTENRIKNLLPEGSVNTSTRLVLVNAIYFHGKWLDDFDADYTTQDTFHAPGGDVTVEMMNSELHTKYAAGSGWQALELPYKNDDYAMLLIVPDATAFDNVEASLDATFVESVAQNLEDVDLQVSMPKFEMNYSANLVPHFMNMGMTAPFNDADFSGIDGTHDLAITGIYHKAFLKIDEHGTEAAAATGVVVGETSMPQDRLVIDRPFFLFIRDRVTGQILFMGRIVDPSGN